MANLASVAPSPPSARALEEHRKALTGHCYRMLGSISEADDAVQETMLRAFRSSAQFQGRASLKTWLYRIATNVCLDALSERNRRVRAMELGPAGTIEDTLTALPSTTWIEPVPDFIAIPDDANPDELYTLRQSIRLAFVAALQHLPPKQRAALLLTEVLGMAAVEVAETLDTTVPAINSALQRARATLETLERDESSPTLSEPQKLLLERYVDAFERYDMDALSLLLREDATMNMPPYSLWLRGIANIRAWMTGRGYGCKGSRLVPTAACGLPAFGQYRRGGAEPWALVVLELSGERVARMTYFLDTQTFFPRFGLPLVLR